MLVLIFSFSMSKLICGVDEAGRGPVLGPLVMAAVVVKEENLAKLKKLGVKDSKLLTEEKREELFARIYRLVEDYRVEIIEPSAIDLSLVEAGSNLNWLEADTSARLVSEMRADKVVVDCPSPNISVYKNYFLKKAGKEVKSNAEIVVEHKADANHVVVGAASIVAKVIRDREIKKLKKKFGVELGSGYLHDEKTQEFLKRNFADSRFEGLFRKKWMPFKELVKGKEQKMLGEF